MQELRYIRQLGIPELWIKDLTFGVNRRHSVEFLNRLIDEKLNSTGLPFPVWMSWMRRCSP